MTHLPALIQDLALILITAGVVSALFTRIGQPVLLGYIIAGLLVGPHLSIVPTVTDLPNIQIWAEIGIIFLLFALGLEFSLKRLFQVGGAASGTALIEVIGMISVGYFAGKLFGWSTMDSLFLGGILSISSTTIIIRAVDELNLKTRGFVPFVFGVLIVEDLIAILLLVLLSTIAISGDIDGAKVAIPFFKLVFFSVLWFILGVFLLPSLLRIMRRFANEETLLVVSAGLCFSMVVLTTLAGFSPALGAFFMGSILAETNDAERIHRLIRPVKDLFAAIFFVSVGMLIDPVLLAKYSLPIVALTIITIVGKFLTTLIGALASGRSLKHSVQAGMSLSQIGEFSFIIASLGLSLKVTSDFLYPIAVGVSAITTFTTPYMIRSADRVYDYIDKSLPRNLREALLRYELSTYRISLRAEWKTLLRSYGISVFGNSVIIVAVFTFFSRVISGFLNARIDNPTLADSLSLLSATLVSAPFFWALMIRQARAQEFFRLRQSRVNLPALIALEGSRVTFGIVLFAALAAQFVSAAIASVAIGIILVGLVIGYAKRLGAIHEWFQSRFLSNLSDRESPTTENLPPLAPWDAHLAQVEVPAASAIAGMTLEELKFRERFGVTIAMIERGDALITAPARGARLFPGDRLSIIGTDEQIQVLVESLKSSETESKTAPIENFSLTPLRVPQAAGFCGRTIRDSGLREMTDGLVVGIERRGQRILNPDSSTTIEPYDLLWIVGDKRKILALSEKHSWSPALNQDFL